MFYISLQQHKRLLDTTKIVNKNVLLIIKLGMHRSIFFFNDTDIWGS